MSTSPSNTWQCNVHHYCLREARYLMNHIFDIQWSLHIPMTPSPWSVCVLLHNTATVTWGTFFLTTSQTSINVSILSCTFSLEGSKVSVWAEFSPTSSVSPGFESSTKYYPLLSLPPAQSPLTASSQRESLPSTMPSPSSAPFSTPSTAFTTMESARDFKYVCFSLSRPSSLHLLERPKNILRCSNDPNIVNFPFPLTLFAHLLTSAFSQWATHLSCQLFWLCFPRSCNKIPTTENPCRSGAQVWSLPHANTNETQAHFFLCTAIITYVLPCGYSPFCADNTMALAQQNADPEIEFQSPCLNFISDEAKSFIWRLAALDLLHCPTQRLYVTLAYPHSNHHHHYRHTTPRRPLPRRHNLSPRAKWHSALTDIRAANKFSYFTATAAASRSSTQSSGGWNNQDPTRRYSSTVEGGGREGWPWPRRHYAWFFWTCSSRIVASLHGSNREKSRWYSDASSCKVENHITLLKIQWTKNLREQLLEGDWDLWISMNE